jgi:hypothetical protein
LAARFDMALRDYRRIEKALAHLTDLGKVNALLRLTATASTFAAFDAGFTQETRTQTAKQN